MNPVEYLLDSDMKFRFWNKETKCFDTPKDTFEYYFTDKWITTRYTGIKDQNGKEIYKGDICEVIGNIFENPELIK